MKRASVSTDGEGSSRAARTKVSSDTRCMKNIPVPRRRVVEAEEVELEHLLRAQDANKGVVPSHVREDPEVTACVKLWAKCLDMGRLRALPGHERASKIEYA